MGSGCCGDAVDVINERRETWGRDPDLVFRNLAETGSKACLKPAAQEKKERKKRIGRYFLESVYVTYPHRLTSALPFIPPLMAHLTVQIT